MSSRLPPFTQEGVLPYGEYRYMFDEFQGLWIVKGPVPGHPYWDVAWRTKLVTNLEPLARTLWDVGVDTILIDGSFCEEKDHPRDIDGAIKFKDMAEYIRVLRDLRRIDPDTWNWTRRIPYGRSGETHLPMWHKYRVDLWPDPPTTLTDRTGLVVPLSEGFKKTRAGVPKGIIRLTK